MSEQSLPLGSTATLSVQFSDENEVVVDPSSITLAILRPNGQKDNYAYPASLARTGVGAYQKVVTLDVGGWWNIRFFGAGAVHAEFIDRFYVSLGP